MNKNVCVFASSSNDLDKVYYDCADELGKELAINGFNIVYGGSTLGLMGTVTKSAKKFGSKIYGIMPERLKNFGIDSGECDEFIVSKGMRERKAKMDEMSSAVIALPGGFGTLEEVSEMIVQKQLGYSNKPIIFLNSNGFYNLLIKFLDNVIYEKFAAKNANSIYFIANTPKEALKYIREYNYEIKHNYIEEKLKNQSKV